MKRLLIDHRADGVYTALSENDRIVELFIDPVSEHAGGSWVGRVIVGRIKTILPGLFAFVDIGGKKNAFINLKKGHGLKAGQPILVQVEKDAAGTKGMLVSLDIKLKGRFIVLTREHSQNVGISRKIDGEEERRRLKKIVKKHLPNGYGAIVRTNAAAQPPSAMAEEINALHNIYTDIITRAEFIRPPAVLYPVSQNNDLQSLFSDILSVQLDEIHISTESDEFFFGVKNNIRALFPSLENKILRQGVNLKLSRVLEKEVKLPCGGFITIEQTEACVVIDVNTGSNVGKIDYNETILETNIEAAVEIAAQLRLRNLSGIIIADFIDMKSEANKSRLLDVLANETKKDRIQVEILGFTALGMVEMTRRKTRPPISEFLKEKCPQCGGSI